MRSRFLFVMFATLIATSTASARPAYKQALATEFGPLLSAKLFDCRTCHLPDVGEEKPHNDFGKRLVAVRDELKQQQKKTDLIIRLELIAKEDSDGDKIPNLTEMLLGHLPGDAKDIPTDDELKTFDAKRLAYEQLRNGYKWRPFELVKRPDVPNVANMAWVRNPIDAFIAAEHESRQLKPRPEASKSILVRRLYLDLIGLPPTREELLAFMNDASPDAYEKVVDRLLQSPQYGERWGRHWMDVWRYSDWAGWNQQVRDSQPFIWRWRDWIVESLNADKPYDQMVREMLAADEIAPTDEKTLRATGFLVRNYKLLSREKWMQDTVDHTFLAFQGVTIGCARCHDHMYDPLSQVEYYRLRAVFEPHHVRTDRIPGQRDIAKDGLVRAYDKDLAVKTVLFIRGDDRTPDKTPLNPGVPMSLGGHFPDKLAPIALPKLAHMPDKREFVIEEAITDATDNLKVARRTVELAIGRGMIAGPALRKGPADDLEVLQLDIAIAESKLRVLQSMIIVEGLEDAGDLKSDAWKKSATSTAQAQRDLAVVQAYREYRILELSPIPKEAAQAQAHQKKIETVKVSAMKAEADQKAAPTTAYTKRAITAYPANSTGRRLALANWIANRENPLTARVAMNHIWQRHFGQGIVPSMFDFGRNGRAPSHPALLDWMADEFMARGWSMRQMHKMILMSSTYRQSSTPDDANLTKDRDNVYLWRMNSRRLEAEVVRDQIYYVAGKLDLTQGGPEIDHMQGLSIPRRSLYFRHAAEKQMEFLKLFDAAAVTECYQRKDSVIPQQALAMSNSDLTIRHSRMLARKLFTQVGSDAPTFVRAAFETVLARTATEDEVTACVAFLTEAVAKLPSGSAMPDVDGKMPASDPALRARENLILALMNHHDFVTVR